MLNLRSVSPVYLCIASLLALTGCHSSAAPSTTAQPSRAQIETEREQLDLIPPPTKSTFMTVRDFDHWQNPLLTIQPGMLELHILLADGNTTPIGVGGMFRPINARRQEVAIAPASLGDAMSAIPQTAWPYGRVIAIEEAHKTPASAEPAVRRTMETTISRLNDLGIVVYDINTGKVQ